LQFLNETNPAKKLLNGPTGLNPAKGAKNSDKASKATFMALTVLGSQKTMTGSGCGLVLV